MSAELPKPFVDASAVDAVVEQAEHPSNEPSLTRWAILICAGVFATTMSQPAVLRLPFQNLLKADLHVSRETMSSFFAVSTFAWYCKPLAGIFVDSFPLFGTRKKGYLIISSIIAAALFLVVGIVPRTYTAVLAAMIAVNCMLVVGSTVVGGIAVEAGQRDGATGRLNSARNFVMNGCGLLGGPLGAFLAVRAFGLTTITGAIICLSVIPFALWILKEPKVTQRSSEAWNNAKVQFKVLMKSKILWWTVGFQFVFFITPGFSTPLYYYQMDTLKLSQQFLGTLIVLSGAFGMIGSIFYGTLCSRWSLRTMLYISIIVNVLGTLGYLFYRSPVAAMIIESEGGFVAAIAVVALLDLAARATPKGSESLGFALMISVGNLAAALSDIIGSALVDHHIMTFFNLVWLNAGTTALILIVVPFLPKVLIDTTDL